MSKVTKKMIGFKIDFLLILDGFWEGLGGQVGPKIYQKSMKNRYGKVIEFLIEKWGVRCTRAYASLRRPPGMGSLKINQSRSPRGHTGALYTPLRASGARWRIYIDKYIYI